MVQGPSHTAFLPSASSTCHAPSREPQHIQHLRPYYRKQRMRLRTEKRSNLAAEMETHGVANTRNSDRLPYFCQRNVEVLSNSSRLGKLRNPEVQACHPTVGRLPFQ